ncbi:1-phosphofructokinase [Halospeciosus flavus]|uniref:1-phosphofructokinase n=1 Tax=Halospeciosus flavus TaxID=3032283 RepID=A0ABD5YYX6_9EURY|nr:1-phosphofructokinase [Halospeciosus flavus]
MILTVTPNPAVDQTVRLDDTLSADGVNRSSDTRFDAGGKGVNVAKYLAALDTDTVASGIVGGFLGEYVERELDAAGVANDFVATDGLTRLNTTILDAADEYKVNQTGPRVAATAVDELVETVRRHDPDTVLVGGSLPPGFDGDDLDRLATAGDWRTAVDTGGERLAELAADYDLCKPNRGELADATGLPTGTVEECAVAAEELRESGFTTVVASLGSDGAVLATEGSVYHAPALGVEVTDTVGAGDALLAGVLAALDRGASGPDALAAGVATTARVVQVAGTAPPSFTDRRAEQVEASSV